MRRAQLLSQLSPSFLLLRLRSGQQLHDIRVLLLSASILLLSVLILALSRLGLPHDVRWQASTGEVDTKEPCLRCSFFFLVEISEKSWAELERRRYSAAKAVCTDIHRLRSPQSLSTARCRVYLHLIVLSMLLALQDCF